MINNIFFFFLVLTFSSSCDSQDAAIETPADFPFAINQPTKDFSLDNELEEISGLSLSPSGNELLAVQDEKGHIYALDMQTGEINAEYDFGKKGDYEGIISVEDKVYVVESKGKIHRVKDYDNSDIDTKEYDTPLSSSNNVEGLTYLVNENSLLIALKGYAGLGETAEEAKDRRAIYRFDLEEKELVESPYLEITNKMLADFMNSKAAGTYSNKLLEKFASSNSSKLSLSGIAIHPSSGHLYVLSSNEEVLMIFDNGKSLIGLAQLDDDLHRQPEGISFDPSGNLFIANEGDGKDGQLFMFAPR